MEKIITEKWSSVGERPRLHALLGRLEPGDEVVVWKLDRLGRSAFDLLSINRRIDSSGATFLSLTEGIDTKTAIGKLMFTVLGGFAEFEHSIIKERTRAGLIAAIQRGAVNGRPRALTGDSEVEVIDALVAGASQRAVARSLGVSQDVVRMVWARFTCPEHPRLRGNGRRVIGPMMELM